MNPTQGAASTLPSHVDPARVLDFDMFGLKAVDGEYQKAIYPYTRPGSPEIFWTRANGGHWVLKWRKNIGQAHCLAHVEGGCALENCSSRFWHLLLCHGSSVQFNDENVKMRTGEKAMQKVSSSYLQAFLRLKYLFLLLLNFSFLSFPPLC